MAKAYWVTTYRNISNPDALAEYAKLAAPAIQAGGGRFLVRGTPSTPSLAVCSGSADSTRMMSLPRLRRHSSTKIWSIASSPKLSKP